jgi:hypothetical protein
MANTNISTIEYKNCFVAFLDILGFKSKVIESQDSADKLKILIDSLETCRGFPSEGKKESNSSGSWRSIDIRSRSFSDTMVFFLQTNDEDIAQLFLVIRYLQDRLWEKEICLRGAITIGNMYWPNKKDNITVGPALIKAHKLESEVAIYPRIIVSQDLFGYIEREAIQAYPFGQSGLLKDFIRQDKDGIYFLDLLNRQITRAQDEEIKKKVDKTFSICWTEANNSNHGVMLGKVNEIINDNKTTEDEKIKQKYNWLKSYLDSSG